MIFKKLSNIIQQYKYTEIINDIKVFEKTVEKLIYDCINNYSSYSYDYKKQNNKNIKINYHNIKVIINEIIPTNKLIYPEKDYPFFEHFIYTKYYNKKDIINQLNKNNNYPLLSQLIQENSEIYNLKYLPKFNDFINFMLDEYNFKISRDEAKERNINNEEIYKSSNFIAKLNNFENAWNHIKNKVTRYRCRELPIISIGLKEKLIYYLNDDQESGNGMYIASALEYFIKLQNEFLDKIISFYNDNIYCNLIDEMIPIQEANEDNILLINERVEKSRYKNILNIIYSNIERNIYNENEKKNFYNYNSFIYNFDKIEEELIKIILPGICRFKDNQTFINYVYEGFNGVNSSIIIDIINNYSQTDLNDKEKKQLVNYPKAPVL